MVPLGSRQGAKALSLVFPLFPIFPPDALYCFTVFPTVNRIGVLFCPFLASAFLVPVIY